MRHALGRSLRPCAASVARCATEFCSCTSARRRTFLEPPSGSAITLAPGECTRLVNHQLRDCPGRARLGVSVTAGRPHDGHRAAVVGGLGRTT